MTNSLRDLDEDAAIGRLYLPREALNGAGITGSDPATVIASPTIDQACIPVVARIDHHFAEADKIMTASPRRTVCAPRIMGSAYRIIFERMKARGWRAPRERIRLSRWQFFLILLCYAII
jgi:phytoene synthase